MHVSGTGGVELGLGSWRSQWVSQRVCGRQDSQAPRGGSPPS